MEKRECENAVIVALLLTVVFPPLGIVPLYYALKSNRLCVSGDFEFKSYLLKTYRWIKISAVIILIMYIGAFVLLFSLYYIR